VVNSFMFVPTKTTFDELASSLYPAVVNSFMFVPTPGREAAPA
jgi:hypothetical protein